MSGPETCDLSVAFLCLWHLFGRDVFAVLDTTGLLCLLISGLDTSNTMDGLARRGLHTQRARFRGNRSGWPRIVFDSNHHWSACFVISKLCHFQIGGWWDG